VSRTHYIRLLSYQVQLEERFSYTSYFWSTRSTTVLRVNVVLNLRTSSSSAQVPVIEIFTDDTNGNSTTLTCVQIRILATRIEYIINVRFPSWDVKFDTTGKNWMWLLPEEVLIAGFATRKV
jgi:hypothetical protein